MSKNSSDTKEIELNQQVPHFQKIDIKIDTPSNTEKKIEERGDIKERQLSFKEQSLKYDLNSERKK